MISIIVPPIAVLFLVGVFYKKGSKDGAFWTLILGTLAGLVLFIMGRLDLWPLHYTYNVGIMTVVSTIIFMVISEGSSPPNAEQVARYTFNKGLISEETQNLPWYQSYLNWIGVLLLLIGLLTFMFW